MSSVTIEFLATLFFQSAIRALLTLPAGATVAWLFARRRPRVKTSALKFAWLSWLVELAAAGAFFLSGAWYGENCADPCRTPLSAVYWGLVVWCVSLLPWSGVGISLIATNIQRRNGASAKSAVSEGRGTALHWRAILLAAVVGVAGVIYFGQFIWGVASWLDEAQQLRPHGQFDDGEPIHSFAQLVSALIATVLCAFACGLLAARGPGLPLVQGIVAGLILAPFSVLMLLIQSGWPTSPGSVIVYALAPLLGSVVGAMIRAQASSNVTPNIR